MPLSSGSLLQDPGLLHAGYLADLVAARQLFAFHMPDICVANSTSAALFDTIAETARNQSSLLSVMGYFPQQEVLSSTFHCIDNHFHHHRVQTVLLGTTMLFTRMSSGSISVGRMSRSASCNIMYLTGGLVCLKVVALCSKHHTEISLVSDYCSSLSFW